MREKNRLKNVFLGAVAIVFLAAAVEVDAQPPPPAPIPTSPLFLSVHRETVPLESLLRRRTAMWGLVNGRFFLSDSAALITEGRERFLSKYPPQPGWIYLPATIQYGLPTRRTSPRTYDDFLVSDRDFQFQRFSATSVIVLSVLSANPVDFVNLETYRVSGARLSVDADGEELAGFDFSPDELLRFGRDFRASRPYAWRSSLRPKAFWRRRIGERLAPRTERIEEASALHLSLTLRLGNGAEPWRIAVGEWTKRPDAFKRYFFLNDRRYLNPIYYVSYCQTLLR
jgi:hypothetical protein